VADGLRARQLERDVHDPLLAEGPRGRAIPCDRAGEVGPGIAGLEALGERMPDLGRDTARDERDAGGAHDAHPTRVPATATSVLR
jgi:hypothetical protein